MHLRDGRHVCYLYKSRRIWSRVDIIGGDRCDWRTAIAIRRGSGPVKADRLLVAVFASRELRRDEARDGQQQQNKKPALPMHLHRRQRLRIAQASSGQPEGHARLAPAAKREPASDAAN